jgi:uncharacterized protein DUF4932
MLSPAYRIHRHLLSLAAFWLLIPMLGFSHAVTPVPSKSLETGQQTGTPAETPRILVDPRLELAGVVQLLSERSPCTNHDSLYRKDAVHYFGPYRSHPVVEMFRKMSAAGFNSDAVYRLMIRLSSPPDLRALDPIPGSVIAKAGGQKSLEAFLAALRDFAGTTRLMTFLASHEGTFSEVIGGFSEQAERPASALGEFAGVSLQQNVVVLGMLFHEGGLAEKPELTDAGTRAWSLLSPTAVVGGLPDFGTSDRISDLVLHDFAHAIVNPLTERYRDEVLQSATLLGPIREEMAWQGFTEWSIVVNEHIVRALTVVLIRQQRGDMAAVTALNREVENCFIYLPPLVQWLDEYSQRRSRYPKLSDFYPVMLQVLSSRARAQAAGRFLPACQVPVTSRRKG